MACVNLKTCFNCLESFQVYLGLDIEPRLICPDCETNALVIETIDRLETLSELTQLSQDLGMYD